MNAQLVMVGGGMLLYVWLCIVACLAGYGLLHLLGLAKASPAMGLLSPGIALVFWALCIGLTVGLRMAMKDVTPWLWGVTAVLMLNGMRRFWLAWRYEHALLLLCALLPIVVMARYFWHGISDYSGSIAPDGWSYIAYGQYLWEYKRGTDGGLAPLYQYAAHLSSTRYVSAALLGFFSFLVAPGDTQVVSSLFQAWTLFCMAGAIAFFWATEGSKQWIAVLAIVLSTVTGWIANLIWANNFDNGLALFYLPAFAGIANLLDKDNWRWWLLLGGMLGSLLYVYPELAPLIGVGAAVLVLPRVWSERRSWWAWLRGSIIGGSFAFVLVLPVLNDLVAFVFAQMKIASISSGRPGEGLFGGLIIPRFFLAALWGLGGEHQIEHYARLRNILGLVLVSIGAVGMLVLLHRRKWGLAAAIALFLVSAAYFVAVQHYSYGAYKLLVIDWWGMVALLMIGTNAMIERMRRPGVQRACMAGLGLLLLVVLSQSSHIDADTTSRYTNSPNQPLSMDQYRGLRDIKQIVGSDAVMILVNEWLANEWAVYYLHDIPIDLIDYRMYMAQPHVLPYMRRAQAVLPEQAGYILTDVTPNNTKNIAQDWQIVWSGGPYQLLRPKDSEWAAVMDITNANGIEQLDGEQFFWIGQGPTTLHVYATHTGVIQLSSDMLLGPSLPEQQTRRLQVAVNDTLSQTLQFESGYHVLAVPVVVGDNTITLTPLDKPSRASTNGGDPRTLLLGVKGMAVLLQPQATHSLGHLTLQKIENPNGLEHIDGEQFFWVGQGTTVIHLLSERDGLAAFQSEILLGPSLPEKIDRRVQISTDHGYTEQVIIGKGTYTFTVPVVAGTTDVRIQALDTPSQRQTGQGDLRPLLLGMKGLLIWFQEQ